jgi:hypothetical protein
VTAENRDSVSPFRRGQRVRYVGIAARATNGPVGIVVSVSKRGVRVRWDVGRVELVHPDDIRAVTPGEVVHVLSDADVADPHTAAESDAGVFTDDLIAEEVVRRWGPILEPLIHNGRTPTMEEIYLTVLDFETCPEEVS